MHDHDHNPTDDATDAPTDGPTTWRTDDNPADPPTTHAVEMTADDGTVVVHYSDGTAGHWVRADRSDLVDLEAHR